MSSRDILASVIETQYLDNGNFDVFLKLPDGYSAGANAIVISQIQGANAFLVANNELHTPEITITAYVTKHQDSLLRLLYTRTVYPGHIDQTLPITLEWGDISSAKFTSSSSTEDGILNDAGVESHDFYLANYTPPTQVEFERPELLSVSLDLRLI